MQYLPISGFPIVEPEDADPELTELYDEIKRETELPFVPNWAKVSAASPGCTDIYLGMLRAFNRHINLPQPVVSMILYSIATTRNCTYCSVNHELYCRTLGVDEDTLDMLVHDLDGVSPVRLRAIIKFALKSALEPQTLVAADYERVREQGISDDELIQILFLAALGNFNDTLADSFKIKAEDVVLGELGR